MTSLRLRIRRAAEYVEMARRRPLLLFEITARCNQECRFCYNVWKGNGSSTPGELGPDSTREMIDRALRGSGGRHVTFTGGEPLLREDLDGLVGHLTCSGVTTTVITNGRLLDGGRARSLKEAGLGLLEIPLLSTDRDVHDDLTRVAGSFDRTLAAIAEARAVGLRVVAVFVATRRNLKDWSDTIRLSVALGSDGILFNRFNPGGAGIEGSVDLLPSISELEAALAEADRAVAELGVSIGVPVPIPPCTLDQRRYRNLRFHGCEAGTRNAYWTIDPVGNVRPCNHSPTVLGNVLEEPFQRITSKAVTRAWVCTVPSSCRRCVHVKRCRGGCKAAAQVCAGSLDRDDPFVRLNRREGVGSG